MEAHRIPSRPFLVLPTLNEAGTVEEVIRRALQALPAMRILVVDDGSTDGTLDVLRRIGAADGRIWVLGRDRKLGLGDAYRTGFRRALEEGADAVIEMDADLSHDPADLSRLVDALADADLVIGSRYRPGGAITNWPLGRRLLSSWANRAVRRLLGLPVTDSTSGFRCYRAPAIAAVGLDEVRSDGYAFQIEMAWRAQRAGLRIVEIPISFVERDVGESKLTMGVVGEALVRLLVWSIRRTPARRGERPVQDDQRVRLASPGRRPRRSAADRER